MEHRQLLNFLSICDEKSITKAAELRFITRQGLSKSLWELESELGVKLFERSRNGITLTEYGQILEKAARTWIKEYRDMLDTLKDIKEKSNSQLSVGIADSFVRSLSSNFFSSFLKTYPEIDLSIITLASKNCQKQLLENKIPVGITIPPIDIENFQCFQLLKKKFYLIVGKNHHLAGRASVELEELKGEEAITRISWLDQDDFIARFCIQHDIKTHTRLSYLEPSLIKDMLETGRYIIFASESSFLDRANYPLIEVINADIYIEFCLVINKQVFINKAAERFIAWTQEQFAHLG